MLAKGGLPLPWPTVRVTLLMVFALRALKLTPTRALPSGGASLQPATSPETARAVSRARFLVMARIILFCSSQRLLFPAVENCDSGHCNGLVADVDLDAVSVVAVQAHRAIRVLGARGVQREVAYGRASRVGHIRVVAA